MQYETFIKLIPSYVEQLNPEERLHSIPYVEQLNPEERLHPIP
jgi:hypothetical protein